MLYYILQIYLNIYNVELAVLKDDGKGGDNGGREETMAGGRRQRRRERRDGNIDDVPEIDVLGSWEESGEHWQWEYNGPLVRKVEISLKSPGDIQQLTQQGEDLLKPSN